jgi:Ala-tRNA(Pro) deacylase
MPAKTLKKFLDENNVRYVTIQHSKAYTAQDVAASSHISGKEIAKTVMVKLGGKMAMAVVPASRMVDLEHLRDVTGVSAAELATESEFKDRFPGCEVGAMPPFGNLYGLDVFVDVSLREDEEIAFNAGSHTELVRLAYADFERLVQPKVMGFAYGD